MSRVYTMDESQNNMVFETALNSISINSCMVIHYEDNISNIIFEKIEDNLFKVYQEKNSNKKDLNQSVNKEQIISIFKSLKPVPNFSLRIKGKGANI